MADAPTGYLGSNYPTPTDPSYYLNQTGLNSLTPGAFNADTLNALFSPSGMQWTPQPAIASNPFAAMMMNSADQATHLKKLQTGGQAKGPNESGDAVMGMQL